MTYVTANLHGDAEGFKALLQTLKFKDKDILYVLGDSVDFGEGAMDLLIDMSMRDNVFPLAGEHDLKALRMLSAFQRMLDNGEAPSPAFSAEMTAWAKDGGMATLAGYRALDADMREGVLDYLSEFTLCEEVEIGSRSFVLAHAGLANYDADKLPEGYTPEDVFSETLPAKDFFATHMLVVGHTPTARGKIEYRDGVYHIDCGAGRGGRIAALCLETGEEYYV